MIYNRHCRKFARIAQMVEQWTENPRVGGSIPSPGTFLTFCGCGSMARTSAFQAECVGSIPITRLKR